MRGPAAVGPPAARPRARAGDGGPKQCGKGHAPYPATRDECPVCVRERKRNSRLQRRILDTLEEARQARHTHLKVYHRSLTIEWETPQTFFDALHAEFGFTLDAAATPANAKCPRHFTTADNGLVQPWDGICWMNPPYGRTIGLWVAKAFQSAQDGATVVCLLPVRSDTQWWQGYVLQATEIRYVAGRLTFGGATNPAPFPNAVVVYRPPS